MHFSLRSHSVAVAMEWMSLPEFSSAKTDLMGAAGSFQGYWSVSRDFSPGMREIVVNFNNESSSGGSSYLHLYTYVIFMFIGINGVLLVR